MNGLPFLTLSSGGHSAPAPTLYPHRDEIAELNNTRRRKGSALRRAPGGKSPSRAAGPRQKRCECGNVRDAAGGQRGACARCTALEHHARDVRRDAGHAAALATRRENFSDVLRACTRWLKARGLHEGISCDHLEPI